MTTGKLYACLVAMVSGSAAFAGGPRLLILDEDGLNTPPTGAYSISADGTVLGGFARQGAGLRAFRWTAQNGIMFLDTLTGDPTELTLPYALNHDGSAAFGLSQVGLTPIGAAWDAASAVTRLDAVGTDPGSGMNFSYVSACNYAGTVAVGVSTSSLGREATRWDGAGPVGLGGLRSGTVQDSHAFAVDADGEIRGHARDDANRLRLFIWNDVDGMTEISQSVFDQMNVVDASPDGRAMTGGALRPGGTVGVPFLWTAANGVSELPMPSGANTAFGYAVSDNGQVVAGRYEPAPTNPGTSGFVWTASGGTIDLLDYCRDTLGIDPGDWVLYPEDLDASGRFLVGQATYHPNGSAVVLAEAAFVLDLHPVCEADLAEPFGSLNFFDIIEYIARYNAQSPDADLAEPFGAFNIFDILAYIDRYNAGCP